VAFIYAGFGLAIFLARRTPAVGPCVAASDKAKTYSTKKGFTFGNILHFTPLKWARSLHLVRFRLFPYNTKN
jgi:hypothetical protein